MGYGVMVAQKALTLHDRVRIPVSLLTNVNVNVNAYEYRTKKTSHF